MSLDPKPLLDAARWGRPWHDPDGCTLCERGTLSDRVPACVTPAEIAKVLSVDVSTVQKWRSGKLGVSQKMGERCAATLGLLDHEVWPELLELAIADVSRVCEGCGSAFVPTRKDHRFCKPNCRQKTAAFKAAKRARYASDEEYRESRKAKMRDRYEDDARAKKLKRRLYYLANREREIAASRELRRRKRAAA